MNFVIDADLEQNIATLRGKNYTYKCKFTDLISAFDSNIFWQFENCGPLFKAFKKNIDTETEAYIKLVEPDLHERIFPEKYNYFKRKDPTTNELVEMLKKKNYNPSINIPQTTQRTHKSIFEKKPRIQNKKYR